MSALVQVQRELASTDETPEQLMERIPALALGVVPASGAVFELLVGGELVLKSGTARALAMSAIGIRLPLDGSLSGEAVRLGRTVRCDDTESDPRVALDTARRFGVRSVIATVVRCLAGPIGVLKLFDFAPGHFAGTEADCLALLAEALGAVIQRKRAEAAAARSLRNQAGIVRLQHRIASSPDGLQAALDIIVEGARDLTGADGATIAEAEGEDFVVRAACGIAAGRMGHRLRRRGSLAALSLAHDEILCCDDTELDPRVDIDVCRSFGARSLMLAPLRAGGEADGALRVFSSRVGAFTSSDVGTLQILAEWLGMVMQRQAVTDRLRESEAQYRMMFAAHALPMWVYDAETLRFLAVNDSAVAHYGHSRDEFLAMTLRDIRTPEGNAQLDAFLRDRTTVGKTVMHWQHRRKDGSIIDVESSDSTIEFGGRTARLVLAQDVTERKQAERRIRRSESLLSIGGRAARMGGWFMELPGREFDQSDEICAIFDLPAGTRGAVNDALRLYVPESRARLEAAVALARKDGTPYDLELEAVTATGRRIWVRTIAQELYDADGVLIGAGGAVQDITDMKLSQEKVRALAANLTSTLESITDSFYTLDREWRFTYVNGDAEKLIGRPRSELLGRSIWEAIPRLVGTDFERQYRDAMAGSAAITLESYYPYWGMWLEVHAYPSESGLAVHFRDVSERHAAQAALRSVNENLEAEVARRTAELELTNVALAGKEEEIRSVVEHMADGVITFADDGIVRSANSKIEAIFGHLPSALVGRHLSVLIPAWAPSASAGPGASFDADETAGPVGRETSGVHRDGTTIILDVALSSYRTAEQRLWTAILRDIGERVRIVADLEQARIGAEEASRAKSAFVATMSHEIRTPMNGVIGMIDVLHQTPLAPDQAQMLGVARESAHSLLAIIEDILDFSKIEAGRFELERLPLSIASVVQKVSDLVGGMAVAKGVELVTLPAEGLPATVWGDAVRLRQVLVNLLSNAIKFSAGRPGARVTVRAGARAFGADGVELQLEVEDNGIGMDAGTVERLFVPFSQADASTTRRFGGTGLGLAISHHLVQLMGGAIEVRSTDGVGSVFTVRVPFTVARRALPAVEADAVDAVDACDTPPPEAIAAPQDAASPGRIVLVAEDNEVNQQVIVQQLKHLGFRAEVVGDGRLALELWRTGRYGVVLTDLQMPEMDGYELTAAIRTEERDGARIPILALTANALKEEESRCRAAGMDGYLTKPVAMSRLGEIVRRWLDRAPAEAISGRDVASVASAASSLSSTSESDNR